MVFIVLLALTVVVLAGAAEFFSVYGLAATFPGVFWSVVVMGAALGAGKLMGVSYLYRYWDQTGIALKTYLMAGIAALMLLTSLGIFGFLSSGYQQDVLPLKQKQEQITLLEDEKARALTRKKQIDDLMAGGPAVTNLNRRDGSVDANATRALRETTRSRETLVRQYRVEQEAVTARIVELDRDLLGLKQDVIKSQAKVGPITFVAEAFGLPTDKATTYLILVIIFAFDPMAVALTLALNIAIRLREEQKNPPPSPDEKSTTAPGPAPSLAPAKVANDDRGSLDDVSDSADTVSTPSRSIINDDRGSLDDVISTTLEPTIDLKVVTDDRGSLDDVSASVDDTTFNRSIIDDDRGSLDDVSMLIDPHPTSRSVMDDDRGSLDDVSNDTNSVVVGDREANDDRGSLDDVSDHLDDERVDESQPLIDALPPSDPNFDSIAPRPRFRPYPGINWEGELPSGKMRQLINHHKYLKAKQDNGDTLTPEEVWELKAVGDVLRKNGIDLYL